MSWWLARRVFPLFCCLLFLCAQAVIGQGMQFDLKSNGLRSVKYNGWELIGDTTYQGVFGLYGISTTFRRPDGTTYSGTRTPARTVMNYATATVTLSFDWGTATCTYAKSSNTRLQFHVTLTNNSSADTLTSASFSLIIFDTPIPNPYADDAQFGHLVLQNQPRYCDMQRQPGAILVDLGATGKMAICNENDPHSKDTVGGLTQYNSQSRFNINASVNEDVAPGTTHTLDLSLRFADSTATMHSLAGDIYQHFDAAFPLEWRWDDRRLLGCDFLSSTIPHPADGKNPRGWLNNDDTIDITTDAGLQDFQARMLQRVDNEIVQMQQRNVQGIIIWDIEGQQMWHPVSYVGDPHMVFTVAPEMGYKGTHALCVADEIFKKFRDAGIKVGVCVRPQEYYWKADENRWDQRDAADPAQELFDDIAYAVDRWGCTLFYIDSTVMDASNIPATALFSRIQQTYPDLLLMPENQDAKYYGYGAPYDQLNFDAPGTSARWPIDLEYRGAATALKNYNYTAANHDSVLASLKRGDILIANSWYPDPDFTAAKALYDERGALPTVSLTAPADQATVQLPGSVTVTADATCAGKTIGKVEFFAGPVKIGEDAAAPFTVAWTPERNGSYCLYAKASTTDGCSMVARRVQVAVEGGPAVTATPGFGLAPGTYATVRQVALTCATPGAFIRYTLDGTTPSQGNGLDYAGPLNIFATTTVKAIAYAPGLPESAMVTGTFTITAPVHAWTQTGTAAVNGDANGSWLVQAIGDMPARSYKTGGVTPPIHVEWNCGMTANNHGGTMLGINLPAVLPATITNSTFPAGGLYAGVRHYPQAPFYYAFLLRGNALNWNTRDRGCNDKQEVALSAPFPAAAYGRCKLTVENGQAAFSVYDGAVLLGTVTMPLPATLADDQKTMALFGMSNFGPNAAAIQGLTLDAYTGLTAVSLAVTPAPPQVVNSTMTLTAIPTGGTQVEYRFRAGYKDAGGWHWTELRDYAATRTCSWTPTAAAVYTLVVCAREHGSTTIITRTRSFTITTPPPTTVTLTMTPPAPTPMNTAITLTADAGAGVNEYQFRAGYADGGRWTWTILQPYSLVKTCTWTPTEARRYTLMVYARARGIRIAYQAVARQTYLVTPLPPNAVTLTCTPASPQPVNTTITLSAQATGGGQAEYRFRTGTKDQAGAWHWTVIKDYSQANSCTWQPAAAGQYTLVVSAREAGGVVDYRVYKSVTYQVTQ